MLNAPLWTLATSFAVCDVCAIPSCPLSTFTTGSVAIPAATSAESLIVPVGVLENPTSVIFKYSPFILRKSVGWIELIPLRTNCDKPIPILLLCVNPSNTPILWVIDVNVIGCCTTPSRPIKVLVICFLIVSLWALPEPVPVNVTGFPVATYSGLVYNSNLFSSNTFA